MRTLKTLTFLALMAASTVLFAQTITYTKFPASETVQSRYWHQVSGCHCGIDPNFAEPFRKSITVSPTQVQTRVNQSVQIRYDASTICQGQGITDLNGVDISKPNFAGVGTIQFEAGAIKTLPDTYGIMTFSGYKTAKTDTIHIKVNTLQCYDTGAAQCSKPCSASIDIPVTITQ